MNAGQLLESLALFAGSRTRRLLALGVLFGLVALVLAGCDDV
jgi:predicted O-methyltransferase YrrM